MEVAGRTLSAPEQPGRSPAPAEDEAEGLELLFEAAGVVAEVEEGLALGWRAGGPVVADEFNAAAGEADGACVLGGVLEPGGLRAIVGEHDGIGDAAGGVFLHHLGDEVGHERLGVGRVEPDAAVPGHGEPIIVRGKYLLGLDGFLRGRLVAGVEVDAAEHLPGAPDILGRGEPLVASAFGATDVVEWDEHGGAELRPRGGCCGTCSGF